MVNVVAMCSHTLETKVAGSAVLSCAPYTISVDHLLKRQ